MSEIARTRQNRWTSATISGLDRSSGFVPFSPYSYPGYTSSETITDQTHGRSGGRWSAGGPMFLTRNSRTFSPDGLHVIIKSSGGTVLTNGAIRMGGPKGAVPPDISSYSSLTENELNVMGTTAIARTEPTNPAFDLSTAIGELLAEGLPVMPGSGMRDSVFLAMNATKTRKFKSMSQASAGEFLNKEFGWAPLVRNVQDFSHVVNNSDNILRQYQEGSGKVIQRSYQWPTESRSQAYACSFNMTPGSGTFTGGGRFNHAERRTWFEAEYRYYVPAGGSRNDKFRRFGSYARKLLGVDLSPEVLWNLSPWSWAADWFTNAGDVMHNISALGTDGLTIRNGYIMSHSRYETQDTGQFQGVQHKVYTVSETKRRTRASPYGFGVLYEGLSLKQKAIAAAVGYSRW
nr:MAG: hypothetical protein 1 [Leviviridae sp.]